MKYCTIQVYYLLFSLCTWYCSWSAWGAAWCGPSGRRRGGSGWRPRWSSCRGWRPCRSRRHCAGPAASPCRPRTTPAFRKQESWSRQGEDWPWTNSVAEQGHLRRHCWRPQPPDLLPCLQCQSASLSCQVFTFIFSDKNLLKQKHNFLKTCLWNIKVFSLKGKIKALIWQMNVQKKNNCSKK